MTKNKLTIEQQELFNTNFNRQAYETAKEPIQRAVTEAKSFHELWDKLQKYECDVEYEDDFTIIYCEVELDRSHMETEADYVGVCFIIKWYDEKDVGKIATASLYSTALSEQYIADLLCEIDPETCEITEWRYGAEPCSDIDDKQ